MKKSSFVLIALMACGIASAQFAGIQQRGIQDEPMPAGFKPASTNTFLSQYPAVNPQTRQVMFRVMAPYAQSVAVQFGGKHSMKKDDKGVWSSTTSRRERRTNG